MATIEQLGLQIGDRFIHSEYNFTVRPEELVFIEGEVTSQQGKTYLVTVNRCSSNLKKTYPLDPETGLHQAVFAASYGHFVRIPKNSHWEEVLDAA